MAPFDTSFYSSSIVTVTALYRFRNKARYWSKKTPFFIPITVTINVQGQDVMVTAIIQSRRLTLFGHIMRMDDNADAKRILLASSPADWRRQLGRPRMTWLSTVQQDLKQNHL